MRINPRRWSGAQVTAFSTAFIIAAFLLGIVAKVAESPGFDVFILCCFLISLAVLLAWSWMQPQLENWSRSKLLLPGVFIAIFATMGHIFFTPKFTAAFLLFYGIPYGVLVFSWYRLSTNR